MPKYTKSDTINVGQSQQSGSIVLNEMVVTGFIVSASTASGSVVSFLVSTDGTSYYPLYNSSSTEVTITVAGSPRAYNLNPEEFLPWNWVKARLGTAGSPILQATYDLPITFVFDPM